MFVVVWFTDYGSVTRDRDGTYLTEILEVIEYK